MNVLVTGSAGFIGFHTSKRLLEEGHDVIGYDNVNDYYDPKLKESRLEILSDFDRFTFYRNDLEDESKVNQVIKKHHPQIVVHLAAQAGVRYSLVNPQAYIDSNIVGFFNILEGSREYEIDHLVYASSSSVYGLNEKMPFSTEDNVDHPISLYGATKKSNELMAHSYSHLYGLPTTGLRFFTVYGPWGRPDMALFLFTEAILRDKPIKVYNSGRMKRDFTHIDDVVDGLMRVINKPPGVSTNWNALVPDPASSRAPYKVYNIGSNNPVKLMDFIEVLENHLGKKAQMDFLPMQPGDVPISHADADQLIEEFDFAPKTGIQQGIKSFVDWYKDFYSEASIT